MEADEQSVDASGNNTAAAAAAAAAPAAAMEADQPHSSLDPDVTEDEREEGEDEAESAAVTATAQSATSAGGTKRAPHRKRRASQGWNTKKKKPSTSTLTWQEKKARAAANKAAAAAAAAAEAALGNPQQPTNAATETAGEPVVKLEEAEVDEANEGGATAAPARAADEVVEKTERGRPLRASIKARQMQLEEEKRQEEEGRKRRREEKLLAQARSKTKVKKEEPNTPTATQPHSLPSSTQHPHPPPLSSLSSLPSSSSSSLLSAASYPPGPPPPPALVSGLRDASRVVPSHCYGVDWRCVAKLTDCVYTQLHSTHSSTIDWSTVAAMMANVSTLTADECRMLWRCVAYGMDEDGYGRWKRLNPDYEDEADSDIDVDLPNCDEAGVADSRTIIKSSQFRHCAQEDTAVNWTTQHDIALLNVLTIWSTRARQQQHQHQQQQLTATTQPTPRIALSLTNPPLSTTAAQHLPTTLADYQYIASLFLHFTATRASPAFLQARFALLARMALTVDGGGRTEMRERVLAVLGVAEGAEGREWLLHSGGRNWDEKRTVVDRRRRLRRQRRKETGGTASGQKQQPTLSVNAAPMAAVAATHPAVDGKRVEMEDEAPTEPTGHAPPEVAQPDADATAEEVAIDTASSNAAAENRATIDPLTANVNEAEPAEDSTPMHDADSGNVTVT